jgi:FdhD protein
LSVNQRRASRTRARVTTVSGGEAQRRSDWLATEEPLELRVANAETLEPILNHVTMRTPGNDFELAAGFLLAEGYIARAEQIRQMEFCVGPLGTADQQYNIVSIELTGAASALGRETTFRRAVSACGVCGKASIDELSLRNVDPIESDVVIEQDLVTRLPELLAEKQALFATTGGLHAAALLTATGELLAVREDVGRHNAVDKLLGWSVMNPEKTKSAAVLMVSGRLSYELAQKAVVGRLPVLAGVSAPSSLAVDLAREFNLTLIGFIRGESFNVYCGHGRVKLR